MASSEARGQDEHQSEIVTTALLLYRAGTAVALISMIFLSIEGKNVAAGIGLAFLTTGILFLTPQIGDALASRELLESVKLKGRRPTARG
jgi:hypothetical protein